MQFQTYELTTQGLKAIQKFCSTDSTRGSLNAVLVEKVEKAGEVAIKLVATDGTGLVSVLVTEESFLRTIQKMVTSGIFQSGNLIYTGGKSIDYSTTIAKTKTKEPYPNYKRGISTHLTAFKTGHRGLISNENLVRALAIKKHVFKIDKAIEANPNYFTGNSQADFVPTASQYYLPPNADGESLILMMPIRDFHSGASNDPKSFIGEKINLSFAPSEPYTIENDILKNMGSTPAPKKPAPKKPAPKKPAPKKTAPKKTAKIVKFEKTITKAKFVKGNTYSLNPSLDFRFNVESIGINQGNKWIKMWYSEANENAPKNLVLYPEVDSNGVEYVKLPSKKGGRDKILTARMLVKRATQKKEPQNEMFSIDGEYFHTWIGDSDLYSYFKVLSRTKRFINIQAITKAGKLKLEKPKNVKVYLDNNNNEYCYPTGKYSMAPIMSSENKLSSLKLSGTKRKKKPATKKLSGSIKKLTKKQVELLEFIKYQINVDLLNDAYYIKNIFIGIDTSNFSKQKMISVERLGLSTKRFSVQPNGINDIALRIESVKK